MRKIPTLFKRGADHLVVNEVNEGCEWVTQGEGVATRKYDGTCCLLFNGILLKRFDAKHGKTPPVGFLPCQDPDPITGHWPGWVEINPNDKWHMEVQNAIIGSRFIVPRGESFTCELIGPKINGNPERVPEHGIILHCCAEKITGVPRHFAELKGWLKGRDIEGIVWHHPDGRMCKIKLKDFGYKREGSNG